MAGACTLCAAASRQPGENGKERRMKVIFGQIRDIYDEETFRYAKQLGVDGLNFNTPGFESKDYWTYEELKGLVDRCAGYGLTVDFLENVPIDFYDDVMLAGPKRERQIENYRRIIRNMGKAGIPVLGHHFAPDFVWRTASDVIGRGNVHVTAYDAEAEPVTGNTVRYDYVDDRPIPCREELWENYEYFLDAVLPVAEESGVRLAVHPSDPPAPVCGGSPRIFASLDDLKYAEKLAKGSPAWGLNLCLGCMSEIEGQKTVMEAIQYFGPKKELIQIHFRDVLGTLPAFRECFLGEGNFNPAQVMAALRDCGFDGYIMDDHVPAIENDSPWGHRARAHQTGYIMGLIKMLELVP